VPIQSGPLPAVFCDLGVRHCRAGIRCEGEISTSSGRGQLLALISETGRRRRAKIPKSCLVQLSPYDYGSGKARPRTLRLPYEEPLEVRF